MLGTAIVRRLQNMGTFTVIVYDILPPKSSEEYQEFCIKW